MATEDAETFYKLLPPTGALMGFDLGTQTVGLALSDSRRQIASPLITLKRGKFTLIADALRQYVATNAVVGFVLGLPLNMNATSGPRAQSSRAFARNLDEALALPVLLWDERLSTQAVTRTLLEADTSRARRDEVVDKLAAAYILQGALDRLHRLGTQA